MNPDTPQAGKKTGRSSRPGGSAEQNAAAGEATPGQSAATGGTNFGAESTSSYAGAGDTEPRIDREDRPRSQAAGIFSQVRDRASAQLNAQKDRATVGLGSVASAVRQTSEQFRTQQYGAVADVIDNAANRLERFSSHLRERDLQQLIDEAQDLARQQPALFVGTSFAAGLIAARFIKASTPDRGMPSRRRSTDEATYGTTEAGEAGREIF